MFRVVGVFGGIYTVVVPSSVRASCRGFSCSKLNLRNEVTERKQTGKRVNEGILDLNVTSSSGGKRSRRAKKIHWSPGAAAMLILPAFAFSLGCWQVYRLQWKQNLIEQLKKRLSSVSGDFPTNDLSRLDDLEYHRVRVTGEFLHDREFIISPRGRFDEGHKQKDAGSMLSDNDMSSHGAHVFTPFRLANSDTIIMVNRGWIPAHLMSRNSRRKNEPTGVVSFDAIVRKTEKRPQFVGANIPEQGVWFYKDFDQMAKQYGTSPILVDTVYDTTPGQPIGGQTNVNVRNDHLSYLITWFSLTAVTVGMWIAKFRR